MMGDEEELQDVQPSQSQEEAAHAEEQAQFVVGQSSLAYVGVLVCAVVLTIALTAGASEKGHQYYGYGIALAVIAMVLSLAGWLLAVKIPGQAQNVLYLNYLIFAWCFIGACIMTFGGPFRVTGNGYFASWGMAIFATMALGVNASTVKSSASAAGPMAGLFVSSVVVLIAISSHGVKAGRTYFAELLYSLIITLFSIIFSGASLKGVDGIKPVVLPVTAVFAVLWSVAACLLTFRGPFLDTGNGYFGAWGGALTSVFAANAARKEAAGTA